MNRNGGRPLFLQFLQNLTRDIYSTCQEDREFRNAIAFLDKKAVDMSDGTKISE
jgi:hypothetical protein